MTVLEQWKECNKDQKVFIFVCLSIFFPFYMSVIFQAFTLIYVLLNGTLLRALKNERSTPAILIFSIISALNSWYSKNDVGIICSFVILVIFCWICYYRYYGDFSLLRKILKLITFMSILCGIYGLMEYNKILDTHGFDDFTINIFDKPKDRINSTFFNANYYAMMIEFFVLITSFLLVSEKRKDRITYYSSVIIFNLFLLYLTGCRTAWPALGLGLFYLFFNQKDSKWFVIFTSILGIATIVFIINPEMFPRINNVGHYLSRRIEIWKLAIVNIHQNIWFGKGPLAYWMISQNTPNAVVTQHAHNIFIDPFLSYGFVGVLSIFPYFYNRWKEYKNLKKELFPKQLVASIVATTICHGLMDYTVYFVPTGFIFLLIINSCHMKRKA